MLEIQDIEVTEEARERILGCTDSAQLKTWATRSKNITHVDELFSE